MENTRFVTEANAIESLRSSDFDANSAYGEVIDNSIQAEAKNIKIKFTTKRATGKGNRGYEHIETLAFGDDGIGMNVYTLQHCAQIGWSSRYNQRDGIGRFGVGMTLAAIHECKRVEIYSKQKDENWQWTYYDLDEIKNGALEFIPEPVEKRIPDELKDLVGEESGTLVIWKKYDRQTTGAAKIISDFKVWLGRTFRYFIWDGVHIGVNGEEVKAIDPLYVKTEKSKFPDDPKAELYPEIKFDWTVDTFDRPEGAPDTSPIIMHFSLLPEEWRNKAGDGGSTTSKERYIPDNEGISILRNRREVYYGPIPYWSHAGESTGWSSFENIDRWWGCEIHFDAVLDRAFTVKNIKRGADPSKELKSVIKDKILPSRQTALKMIRDHWNAVKRTEAERENEELHGDVLGRSIDHNKAEKIAKNTPTDKSIIDENINFEDESDVFIKEKYKNYDDIQKNSLKQLFSSQPFTIMDESWRGPYFMDSKFLGGKTVIEYNRDHEFFQAIYEILDNLKNDGIDKEQAVLDLKALLDVLLISFVKSESRFSLEDSFTAEDFFDQMKSNWGQYLNNYVRTWKKENNNE